MSRNLSAIAVRERAVTLFSILLLVAAGAYAFLMLGRAEDPNFTIKTMTVTTACLLNQVEALLPHQLREALFGASAISCIRVSWTIPRGTMCPYS